MNIENPSDRELGMDRPISRRDFLDGVAVSVAAVALGIGGCAKPDAAYPPDTTGLVGQTNAAFSIAHQLRDGTFWQNGQTSHPTRESYDLVVVGGGISGLASAYFYKQRFPNARILIIDNLDDFGGHAKRNEFHVRGRLLLANGGTQSLDGPSSYSPVAQRLLRDLGIDTKRFYRYYDEKAYNGLGNGVYFDPETFGSDRFVAGFRKIPWPQFFAQIPMSRPVRESLARVFTDRVDYLPGLTVAQKVHKLQRTSYADFLTRHARLDPGALPFLQTWTHDIWGLGIDGLPAYQVYLGGDDYGVYPFPGFVGMDLGDGRGHWGKPQEEPYIFHFPDGNASVARMLVRRLIPQSMAGHTMEDIVTAHCDYSQLDRPGNDVCVRLKSTAVRVRHNGHPAAARDVEIAYVNDSKLNTVTAHQCILACWNTMVPYIAPELPAAQKEALAYAVKTPLIYTRIVINNWQPFKKLGVSQVIAPGSYYPYVGLDFPVSIGDYHFPKDPSEPAALFLLRTPCKPGLSQRDQHRAGRRELYGTTFATLERNARLLLTRVLGRAGFDPVRDILAITVNRWAHGYAYEYNALFDPDWPEGGSPAERGRKLFHRIAIANSDAGAGAFTNMAIDQAHRAVTDLLEAGSRLP